MSSKELDNSKAILFMLLHAFAVASLLALMKLLTKDLNSAQVVFFYKSSLFILVLPWVMRGGFINNLKTKKIKLYIFGSVLGTSATLALMYAVKHVPLANATILGYLEKILLVLAGFVLFKEKVNSKKIIAILVSFFGAFIITVPYTKEIDSFNIYYLFIFASIILWVSYCITVKYLGKTEGIKTQTFYAIGLSSIFSLPFAFINWGGGDETIWSNIFYPKGLISFAEIGLDIKHVPLILLAALCYLVVSISFFKSMKYGDLSVITPFGYTKVIFAGILGSIFFQEYPSMQHLLGYFIILGAVWYIAKDKL